MTRHAKPATGDEFGPVYAPPAAAAKWRRLAGKRDLSEDEGRAYGAAVLEGIRAMQRSELQRELRTHRHPCASGTTHSDGKRILAAIRSQQAARLEAGVKADRAARTDAQLLAQYEAAMAEKRARLAREAQEPVPAPVVGPEPVPTPVAPPAPVVAAPVAAPARDDTPRPIIAHCTSQRAREKLLRTVRDGTAFASSGTGKGSYRITMADAERCAHITGVRLVGMPRKPRTVAAPVEVAPPIVAEPTPEPVEAVSPPSAPVLAPRPTFARPAPRRLSYAAPRRTSARAPLRPSRGPAPRPESAKTDRPRSSAVSTVEKLDYLQISADLQLTPLAYRSKTSIQTQERPSAQRPRRRPQRDHRPGQHLHPGTHHRRGLHGPPRRHHPGHQPAPPHPRPAHRRRVRLRQGDGEALTGPSPFRDRRMRQNLQKCNFATAWLQELT